MNHYDEILNMFTSNQQEHMKTPFIQNNYVIATDGHSMVYFDKSLSNEHYRTNYNKNPDAISIIPNDEINVPIPVELLQQICNKSKNNFNQQYTITKLICNDCLGSGTIFYTFIASNNHEYEIENVCPICRGNKTIDIITKNNEIIYDEIYELIKINDILIDRTLFDKSIKIANILKENNMFITYANQNKLIKLKINNISILLATRKLHNDNINIITEFIINTTTHDKI